MTAVAAPRLPIPSFAEVYDEHFGSVWRTVRQLGVQGATIDDVVQETFIVVHRRLAEFAGALSSRPGSTGSCGGSCATSVVA